MPLLDSRLRGNDDKGIYLLDSRSLRPGLHGNDDKGKMRMQTSNNLEHSTERFISGNQPLTAIRDQKVEHIKEKRRDTQQSRLITMHITARVACHIAGRL